MGSEVSKCFHQRLPIRNIRYDERNLWQSPRVGSLNFTSKLEQLSHLRPYSFLSIEKCQLARIRCETLLHDDCNSLHPTNRFREARHIPYNSKLLSNYFKSIGS